MPDSYRHGAPWDWRHQMVHDTHHTPAKRHAWDPHRGHPGNRPHRGGIRSPLFTAGSGYYLPKSLLGKITGIRRTLTIQLYLFMQKAKYNEAFGVAVVLLVIVLGINGLAKYLSHKFNAENRI